jgi:hypothetical protein
MRFSILLLAALAGCATQAKFQANMDGWIGRSEASLVGGMGPPQSVYTIDATAKVLTWNHSGQVVLPGQTYTTPTTTNTTGYINNRPFNAQSTTYTQQQGAPTVIGLNCTVNVTLHDGFVTAWQSFGNNCVSR